MNPQVWLLIASALFCTGVYGLLTRHHAIAILVSLELMANAANLVLVGFSAWRGAVFGQVFALFSIALTVAEVVVGIAIVLLLFRARGDVNVNSARTFSR